ncbi:MAG: GAF domain-containing protein, partial [Chloroflexi bacterium]|nr:GAF domain-containing protein [Chloroflexota bacterium]
LLDETGREAVLREATGDVGAQLKARGYRLAAGSNSLIGWVTANKKPRIALEVSDDPVYIKNELLPDTRSEAAIPLRVGDRLIGVLDVQSREAQAFGPPDIETLQILADQIAVAVENGRLFSRQQRVVQLEQLVADLTAKIHQAPTFESILKTAAVELGQALGARKAVVRLRPHPGGEARPPQAEAAPTDDNGQHQLEHV